MNEVACSWILLVEMLSMLFLWDQMLKTSNQEMHLEQVIIDSQPLTVAVLAALLLVSQSRLLGMLGLYLVS
ncbi:hypothetical protein RJT34_26258 [Clitoria ternatea]|uniref:Uncharacterized protein n=1 Tax=Clitoria ternatea TaxID=43366 RepID=A0AAN9F8Z2_CLITE